MSQFALRRVSPRHSAAILCGLRVLRCLMRLRQIQGPKSRRSLRTIAEYAEIERRCQGIFSLFEIETLAEEGQFFDFEGTALDARFAPVPRKHFATFDNCVGLLRAKGKEFKTINSTDVMTYHCQYLAGGDRF